MEGVNKMYCKHTCKYYNASPVQLLYANKIIFKSSHCQSDQRTAFCLKMDIYLNFTTAVCTDFSLCFSCIPGRSVSKHLQVADSSRLQYVNRRKVHSLFSYHFLVIFNAGFF
jgi:hypothetical protein